MAGRTTLVIAHRLSTISLADRVAVVDDGRIIAEGTHAELLASEPRYAEILAQTDEEAEEPTASVKPRPDLALDDEIATDLDQIRHLVADVGELRDLDDVTARPSARTDRNCGPEGVN